jgi:hypothetical protein
LSRYWRVHCLLLLSLKLTFLFLAYLKALYFFYKKMWPPLLKNCEPAHSLRYIPQLVQLE